MKKLIFSIIACTTFFSLRAQVIEGTVYDAKTRETLIGVVIYLDGTSIYTTSDKEGKFRIVVENKVNTRLVLSHLSYEPLIIQNPFERRAKAFYLEEKITMISGALVVAERFSHEEMIKVFREQFLGTSEGGKSCIIKNEEDIRLKYDRETNTLMGQAIHPIVVENKYLAYHIIFDLHSFSIQYTEETLNTDKAIKASFKGTSSFIDQNPNSIQYKKRREETYLKSSQHFWKSLSVGALDEEKFKIFNRFKQVKPEQYFLISNTEPQKVVIILPGTDINLKYSNVHEIEESVYGVIGIMYKNYYRSDVVFLTDRFTIDDYGNPDTVDELLFSGDMGDQRLGDMLPVDYK